MRASQRRPRAPCRPKGYARGSERAAVPAEAPVFVARALLARTGVVFRKTLAREKQPVPWRDVARALRTMEALQTANASPPAPPKGR